MARSISNNKAAKVFSGIPVRLLAIYLLLTPLILDTLVFSATPANAAIGGWTGLQQINFLVNPVVRVSPVNGRVVIVGSLPAGSPTNPSTEGLGLLTSADNFKAITKLAQPDFGGQPPLDVSATFDIKGNLHIFWTGRPTANTTTVNYLRLNPDLTLATGKVDLGKVLYPANDIQPARPDVASSFAPDTDGRLYLAVEEAPRGVGVWESADFGVSWVNHFTPSNTGATGSAPRIAVSGRGEVHVLYTPNTNGGVFIASKIPSKASQNGFDKDGWKVTKIQVTTGDPKVDIKKIAATDDGQAYAAWVMRRGTIPEAKDYDTISLVRWDPATASWQDKPIDNVTQEKPGQYITIDSLSLAASQNNVVLVYSTSFDGGRNATLRYSVSDDKGQKWLNNRIDLTFVDQPVLSLDLYFYNKNLTFYLVGSTSTISLLLSAPALPYDNCRPAEDTVTLANIWLNTDFQTHFTNTKKDLNTWGLGPWASGNERYDEGTISVISSPNKARQVVYFDKARMDFTNPSVTGVYRIQAGLLAKELLTGQIQLGNGNYYFCGAANVGVAGDSDSHPSYLEIAQRTGDSPHSTNPANGVNIIKTFINSDGSLGADLTNLPEIVVGAYTYVDPRGNRAVNHTIADPFWRFLNDTTRGSFLPGGSDWAASAGLPLTEAYWADVKVANQTRRLLVQAFERRVLTYTNYGNGYIVEWGNVGLHYYKWRYGQDAPVNRPVN